MKVQIVSKTGAGSTSPIVINTNATPCNIGFGVVISGSVDYTVQHSFDDPTAGFTTWFPHPTIAGGLTKQEPPAGKWKLIVAAVVHNTSNGTIFVRLTPGNNIGELDNIQDSSSTSGDLLVKSGSVWRNSKQLTGSYGITGSLFTTGSVAT